MMVVNIESLLLAKCIKFLFYVYLADIFGNVTIDNLLLDVSNHTNNRTYVEFNEEIFEAIRTGMISLHYERSQYKIYLDHYENWPKIFILFLYPN